MLVYISYCGKGISTSAGIPDFRSPDTGLYANLARLNLPYPEAVFDIQYFRRNPKPFYILASELYPGSYRPTPTHSFIRLMADRSLLHTCFTQNIDTLERIAGVPTDKIIEAHGSFATQQCIKCNSPFPDDLMKQHVQDAKIPLCTEKGCRGYVKPDIVFFGQGLPATFFSALGTLEEADLLIIMGTSLTVHPFASLQYMVPPTCPRVLINLDKVGDIGSKADDVVLQMDCDTAVREICDALGQDWRDDLERLWKETEGLYTPRVSKVPAAKPAEEPKRSGKLSGKHNHLADEISRMASR
ncbi:Sir2 histone deacetylase Hst2, partial [Tulasnella sp. 418]